VPRVTQVLVRLELHDVCDSGKNVIVLDGSVEEKEVPSGSRRFGAGLNLYRVPGPSIAGRGFVRCVNLNEFDGFVRGGS